MKKIIINMTIILFVFSISLSAQTKYQSRFIKYLHTQALKNHVVSALNKIISRDTLSNGDLLVVFSSKYYKKGIIAEFTNEDTILTQIGINLFDISVRKGNPYLIEFLERFLFAKLFNIKINQFFANENQKIVSMFNERIIKNWKDRKIKTTLENLSVFNVITQPKKLEITLKDSLGNNLNLIIPKNVNLIMGMDKKELDDYYFYCIKKYSYKKKISTIVQPKNLIKFNGSIFYSVTKQIFKGLDQESYYKSNGDDFNLIFTSKYQLLSFKNLLLHPQLKKLNLDIEQYLYGNRVKKYVKDYQSIFNCLNQGAEAFAGFEAISADSIKFLVVFYQPQLMNSHLLSILLPKKLSVGSSDELGKGTLYTNIRIDNLNNIFEKYKEKKKLLKIEISSEK